MHTNKKKCSGNKSNYVYPNWYTSDLIRDIKTTWRYHKLFKITGSKSDYEWFSYYRTQVKYKLASTYENYQCRLQTNIKNDPKSFWNFVRDKRTRRNKIRVTNDGKELSDEECPECFASFFHSVYNGVRPALDPEKAERAAGASAGAARVHVGQIDLRELRVALRRLKPKYSAGPDGIPPYIVKDCSAVFERPLLHILNLFLKLGQYPNHWKITRVIPVPKGGSGTDVSGYRPVPVLSAFAKVFESVLHKCVSDQVASRLTDAQHGFRTGRGTGSNLVSFMTYLAPVVDAGGQVDAAYFDFRKAFDTVDNDVLLAKFAAFGFTPHLLKFFSSYLGDRRQYVEYGGYISKPYFTFSGVSQGSNFGPLGFTLMVNDLPEVVREAKCLLFADDLKLFLSVANTSDCERLQQDIDRVVQWSANNKLGFNVSKCGIMSYTRAREPLLHQYEMEAAVMSRVTHVRDLGVTMVPELTFREHIIDICGKSFRNLGFILRQCKDFQNTAVVRIMYNALVRSRLETSAIVWNPHEAKYSIMVERIQNKFTRFLFLKLYGVYPFFPLMYPSLFVIGMVGYSRLAVRRDIALCSFVFRVLRGWLHHPDLLAELGLCVPPGCGGARRPTPTLLEPSYRTNLNKFAPLSRAIRFLNIISNEVDIFQCSLMKFTGVALKCIENVEK